MADADPRSTHSAAGPHWLELLATRRRESAIGLFVAAGVVALLVVWQILDSHSAYLGVKLMGGFLAVLLLAAGIWQYARQAGGERQNEVEHTRLLVLSLGAALGLWLTVMSFVLGWTWWEDYFAGGLVKWREHTGALRCVWAV